MNPFLPNPGFNSLLGALHCLTRTPVMSPSSFLLSLLPFPDMVFASSPQLSPSPGLLQLAASQMVYFVRCSLNVALLLPYLVQGCVDFKLSQCYIDAGPSQPRR